MGVVSFATPVVLNPVEKLARFTLYLRVLLSAAAGLIGCRFSAFHRIAR
jgi:hypothetical protein